MGFALRAAIFLTAYHNLIVLLPVPRAFHMPANLAVARALVHASRVRGVSHVELGLSRSAVRGGVRWGAALSATLAAGIATAFRSRKGANLFRDERIQRMSAPQLIYRLAAQIPLGTAIPEEVLFRGVLYGLVAREEGKAVALLSSSAVFGLWHIGPAIDRLRANRPAATRRDLAKAVGGTVATTALGGIFLSAVRIASNGLVGPVILHWAANACGTVAARVANGESPGRDQA